MSMSTADKDYRHAIFPDQPFGSVPDERNDEQWNQIYFLFGQATFRAQAYEDGMACFVIAAEQHWKRSGKSPAEISKLPLGKLQNEYRLYCHLQPFHHEQLDAAVRTRNRLAHGFYRHRLDQLQCFEGRQQVIQELQGTIELFKRQRDEMYWNLSLLTGQPPL